MSDLRKPFQHLWKAPTMSGLHTKCPTNSPAVQPLAFLQCHASFPWPSMGPAALMLIDIWESPIWWMFRKELDFESSIMLPSSLMFLTLLVCSTFSVASIRAAGLHFPLGFRLQQKLLCAIPTTWAMTWLKPPYTCHQTSI